MRRERTSSKSLENFLDISRKEEPGRFPEQPGGILYLQSEIHFQIHPKELR